jgi:hypothetical protein
VSTPREPVIVEDKINDVVIIDGVRVSGFVDDRLGECLHPRIYSHRYDAYFCAADNVWLERACGDESCEFCRDRPAKPFDAELDDPARP